MLLHDDIGWLVLLSILKHKEMATILLWARCSGINSFGETSPFSHPELFALVSRLAGLPFLTNGL